ncbi:hypothetical protein VTP01DRAFT_3934 [Rhizomucor pusillus]|uniref:uncharacterized protein n=1 Tax=Rhizomucor pusillus TaxID=4840 RepID=UPI00374389C3
MFLTRPQHLIAKQARGYATSSGQPSSRARGLLGGLLGFVVGTGLCVGFSDHLVQHDFIQSTRKLATSVDELRATTENVREYGDIVERVDRNFKYLKANAAKIDNLESVRQDLYKLHDAADQEQVQLRAMIWDAGMNILKMQQQERDY